jgi:flagellar motor protein MotB
MIHRTDTRRRVAPASTSTSRPRPSADRARRSASRRRRSARPSAIRRYRRIAATAAIIAALTAVVAFRMVTTHGDTTFNEIAIQPRPASPATVTADVTAELAQAAANGGELVITEIAGNATAAPALDTPFSCSPGTNQLFCEQTMTQATSMAARVARRLVTSPSPANLDVYAAFEQTAGYLSEHPAHHQAINLWINTTGGQLTPANLTNISTSSDITALARQAVATGAFPGPHACDGYQVHMVVPPSGQPAHQQALRDLLSTLITHCGGTLASWTNRWIMPNTNGIALPEIPGVPVTQHNGVVSYTLTLKDFAVASAALTSPADTALDRIAADIESRTHVLPITCTGSTDGTGTAAFDHALSKQRAITVCDYLAHQGISPHLLRAVGAGKATPTAANPSLRRVIITTSSRY